jgi:outer membrane protein OmpA-like peptidoglycan-associated protein
VRGSLIAAALLALATYCGNAQAQTPSDVTGRTPDLNIRIVDLVTRMTDLNFAVQDLRFAVVDLGGKPVEMAGKTEALNVKETATEIRIELAADVLFDFDKADIRQDAASALHQVADIIRDKGRGRAVRIEGHTDAKGSDAYNQKLSERRAQSVRQWLAQKEGVDGSKMAPQGFGARKPVAPNNKPDGSDDPEGRQKNRRVEIVLAK